LEEIIFENFNISENNIISIELGRVLRYLLLFSLVCPCWPGPSFSHKRKDLVIQSKTTRRLKRNSASCFKEIFVKFVDFVFIVL